jgi:hypothetical protein
MRYIVLGFLLALSGCYYYPDGSYAYRSSYGYPAYAPAYPAGPNPRYAPQQQPGYGAPGPYARQPAYPYAQPQPAYPYEQPQ